MKMTVNIKIKGVHELSETVDEMEKLWKKHSNTIGDIKIKVQEERGKVKWGFWKKIQKKMNFAMT